MSLLVCIASRRAVWSIVSSTAPVSSTCTVPASVIIKLTTHSAIAIIAGSHATKYIRFMRHSPLMRVRSISMNSCQRFFGRSSGV